MKMISDQGTIMRWTTVYTSKSTGTVLSPDNYQRSNNPKFNAFQHTGKNNHGSLRQTSNGEWYSPNKVPINNTMENEHQVKQVSLYKSREAKQPTMRINKVATTAKDASKVQSYEWTFNSIEEFRTLASMIWPYLTYYTIFNVIDVIDNVDLPLTCTNIG